MVCRKGERECQQKFLSVVANLIRQVARTEPRAKTNCMAMAIDCTILWLTTGGDAPCVGLSEEND